MKKEERLCSKKVIDKLFQGGVTVFAYPIKIVYIETKLLVNYPAQVGFSASKRNFKRAVDRNLIKRKLREAYRLNKAQLYSDLGEKQAAVFFIYTGKTIEEYTIIESALKKGLKKLTREIQSESLPS